jgi:hypothetical protein
MKVLAFFDDCGHMTAFDMSTPEQELKILEGICKEAAKGGKLESDQKTAIKKFIKDKNTEGLLEYLEEIYLLDLNCRGKASIVDVNTEWETGTGLLDLM